MKKILIVSVAVAGCAAAVIFGLRAGRPAAPNVLLISLDTVRPDHLGCYGYDKVETPNIDSIAGEGIVFTDAITSAPLTLPSHSSVMTGLYPISHGVRENEIYMLADDFTTLAEVFKAKGYSTGAFVGSFVLDSRYGLAQGFDTYDDDFSGVTQTGEFMPPERNADAVDRVACDWLSKVEEPFFAFVHYYDPHAPYTPPAPYDSAYAGLPYDGEIAYTDEALGRLVDVVRDRGLLERTLIVVISDHGEGLGEHGEDVHGTLLYDSTLKVVLIMRIPAELDLAGAIGAPLRIDRTVELTDVFPTLLDMLGIDAEGPLDGRSLVPLFEGQGLPPKACYLETMLPYLAYRWSPLRGVRYGEWKYILGPEEELYNLSADPRETENIISANSSRAEDLKAALMGYMRRDISGRNVPKAGLTPEEEQKLRSLGYVGTSQAPIPTAAEPSGADPKRMIGVFTTLMTESAEAIDRGDYEVAVSKLKYLTQLDPGNPKPYGQLGRALMEAGDLAGAERALLKALSIDPSPSEEFIRLSAVAREQGDLDRALMFSRIAASTVPETPGVLSNLGAALLESGQIDTAMVVLERAVAIDPGDEVALVNLGLALMSEERPDEALGYFRRALDVNPANLKALVNSAYIHLGRGDMDSTISYFERARDAAPSDPKVLLNLGNAYRKAGMVAKAESCFESAADLDPDDPLILFGLAATKAQTGDRQESVALLKRILEIDPNFTPARQALQRLSP